MLARVSRIVSLLLVVRHIIILEEYNISSTNELLSIHIHPLRPVRAYPLLGAVKTPPGLTRPVAGIDRTHLSIILNQKTLVREYEDRLEISEVTSSTLSTGHHQESRGVTSDREIGESKTKILCGQDYLEHSK